MSRIKLDRRVGMIGNVGFATPWWRGSLARDIAWVLVFKIAALILLYVACVAPAHGVAVTPDHVASLLLGAGPGVARP